MTHREKWAWGMATSILFTLLAIGMILFIGITSVSAPSIIASMVIALFLADYASRHLIKHRRGDDHGPRTTPPPEDDEARSPGEDR